MFVVSNTIKIISKNLQITIFAFLIKNKKNE